MSNSGRKIYVVGDQVGEVIWMQGFLVRKMEDADLVAFTGGADVSPNLYNEQPHQTTLANIPRDMRELEAFKQARTLGKKMVGICRGSQFLCVMAGGKLVQDQEHPASHEVTTTDGRVITVTSDHHQAAYPWALPVEEFKLLGWANGLSQTHEGGNGEELPHAKVEIEFAYYPKIKALGIQSHPEYVYSSHLHGSEKVYVDYCRELLDKHMNNDL